MTYDYSDYKDEATPDSIGDNALARLQAKAQEQLDLEALMASLENQLAEATKRWNQVRIRELPDLMDELELTQFKLRSGVELNMAEEIRAGIKDEHREAAHKWLEDHDNGGLIKRQVVIEFGREEEGWARKFMRDCAQRKKKLNLAMKKSVHAGTLKSFVKGCLDDGVDIPQDLFGVMRQRFVKIKMPKERK